MTDMFCYQCQETMKNSGCIRRGMCGKSAEVSRLQDLLIYLLKGISFWGTRGRDMGVKDDETDLFVAKALFSTITNANFATARFVELIKEAIVRRDNLRARAQTRCNELHSSNCNGSGPDWAGWHPEDYEVETLLAKGRTVGVMDDPELNEDIRSMRELVIYGLKGIAAYVDHAYLVGGRDESILAFLQEALEATTNDKLGQAEMLALIQKTGECGVKAMALLDASNTGRYGNPEPTQVFLGVKPGKGILVSGHDLPDLEELLQQTEGTGINIYTHGEMLPTHGYPGLKKYKHFVGNYGGAWQDQQKEFAAFPGAILMTTNCIQKPAETYKSRIFTCGLVAWPGVVHITDRNFKPVIDAALAAPGFAETEPEKTILVGFGRNAVLGAAPKVIELVQAGKIRHFFLIGGCDGAKSGRNYYTDLATQVPKDCVILTLACGKYRFNKLEFGDIEGIPRLLDIGQCNDAYSAVKIALALADAFKTDVNGLPLSLVLSWYEQKAVCILLSLLFLGVRNIRIGPSAPAFLTPAVFQVLHDKLNLMPITTPEQDLKAILG